MHAHTMDDTLPLALTHNDYRIRSHWSGQVGFVAGGWHHAHWTDVMSRVNNMRRIASDSGHNIIQTITYLPDGSRKIAFLFDHNRIEAQESVILWITPS